MTIFKHPLFTLLLAFVFTACSPNEPVAPQTSDSFDAKLAAQLGADEYGMRSYVMVVLKTGPKDAIIKGEARKEIFKGHFSNMKKLGKEGKLVLAGPFMEAGDKRGLYIFNVQSIEDAKSIVQTDPAVAAGIFTPEFTKYYGSAALMQINDVHTRIQETKF